MELRRFHRALLAFAVLTPFFATLVPSVASAATVTEVDPSIPTPKSVLGEEPGADFYLASYDDSLGYFKQLAEASDRVRLERVGETSGGLPWYLAIISTPENLEDLDLHIGLSRRLAAAKGLNDESAAKLADEARAIVHIDGGLHATEAACAQHTINLAYRLAAADGDPTIDAILDQTILVLWFSMNPDGQNMLADWYRRNLGTPFEVAPLPWLYQKYAGHDNNRDGYMHNTHESRVVTEMTLRFQPHVFYNHHQTAPFPARIWIPPFAEPISSNVHPLIWRQVNRFGTSMATWLDEHAMAGAIHRGDGYDDWYPGFVDHVNSFRNTVSFLTETALYRYATPKFYPVSDFPRDAQGLRSESMYASPWKGGWWRLGDAVEYMEEASMAVLDTAAKYRRNLAYNRYQAGRDTIQRFRNEPPYAYVIPDRQHDPSSAAELVGVLQRNGIEVHRATASFVANGMEYAAGDTVVLMDQPFSLLVKELFETQEYPEIRPGGKDSPLDLPYDVAGWTLPIQMNVDVDAIRKPLAPAVRQRMEPMDGVPWPRHGTVGEGAAWRLPRSWNASWKAIWGVIDAGGRIAFDREGRSAFVTGVGPKEMERIADESRVPAVAIQSVPELAVPVTPARIGVYRPWSPSMDEGWTRWLCDEFGVAYSSLYNEDVLAGRLDERYDVIVIADISGRSIRDGFKEGTVPGEFAGGLGDDGVANLRSFVDHGGTLVCFDGSARFAIDAFGLDIEDPTDGKSRDEFFCSGSLLRVEPAAHGHALLAGMPDSIDVMFASSEAFEPGADFDGSVVLRFPKKHELLRSGILIGEELLRGLPALLSANYGEGRLILFGFRPQWRGQPHGTFKLVFNAMFHTQAVAREFALEEGSGQEGSGQEGSGQEGEGQEEAAADDG